LRGLGSKAGEMSRLIKIDHIAMRQQRNRIAFGTRTLWGAAAVLAATWNLGILVALSLQEESDQTTRASQQMDGGASELRKSMLRDQAARMERDLAVMRRNVEPQTAAATRTVDEASPAKQPANAGLAGLQKSLQLERDRAGKLEQELATALRDVKTQAALAEKAGVEASQLKKTADAGTAVLRKSLQQERDRASKLEQDLAAARRDVETQTALAVKAGQEAAQLKQVAEKGSAEQRQSFQQEHDKAEALAQELSTARSTIYACEAQARRASDEAAELEQAADGSAAKLRKSLVWEREARLQQDVETNTALATRANAEAARLKQAAESGSAELSQSLQRERDKVAQLERDLALARSKENVVAPSIATTDRINTQSEVAAAKPIAAEQAAVVDAPADRQSTPEDAAEVARLLARAIVLLGRGDIGSARNVLQRATEMGDAQASFTLAETYDPLILSKWGTYGTLGDARRALDLYARAFAGGINEAKERSNALRR
jgi:hypothetical protein